MTARDERLAQEVNDFLDLPIGRRWNRDPQRSQLRFTDEGELPMPNGERRGTITETHTRPDPESSP